MLKDLEHSEHAEHLAHSGAGHGHAAHGPDAAAQNPYNGTLAALLVAVLAAGLAVTEQGAKHAEIRVTENSVFATDAWAQYQAKSTRGTFSKDLSDLLGVLGPTDPAVMALRTKMQNHLNEDQERFERDPKDGKDAIFKRARAFEEVRDHSLEQSHAFDNGGALMELGIVLSTASAIIKSRLLVRMAFGFGVVGAALAILGLLAPEYAAF
jgi:hypothetical protein